ncbi:MAG: RsmB/NOP family class I SAM-dependent RNA methyltransferase [Clostridia bacterium]|nr:RsmB/NOP family class I SAM-dependent RNA methyltransferase [Clostridia bacterium]
MKKELPQFLSEILEEQYSKEDVKRIVEGYSSKRATTLRVNTLKSSNEEIENELSKNGINFSRVDWYNNAIILENANEVDIRQLSIYEDGKIYLQSLSSMLPAILLEPKANENILDMAAAPGGKTTQISALTENLALITACEKNKIRADRLMYNIEKQGAKRINIMREDARKLDDFFSFDKILLDAPCSGSGTISLEDENLDKNFTIELVKRAEKTQFELLSKAIKILKPGHEMIYSTCSILKNENEENLNKILKTGKVEVVPLNEKITAKLPLLPSTIKGTITVCPTNQYEGFFVAKIRKI